MKSSFTKRIEDIFEGILWKFRSIVILPVIFSTFSALCLFVAGSYQIVYASRYVLPKDFSKPDYHSMLSSFIAAIDLYLIGLVLLIFSFGVYELFISKLDPAHQDKEINILEIKSLDDLKNRLLKVIVMALVVHFFKTILDTHFQTAIEMLYMGIAILSISACTYFIRRMEKDE